MKLILQRFSRSEEERRDKEGRIRDLYRLIDEAINRGDVAEAERQMVASRLVYPEFAGHALKEQRIREARSRVGPPEPAGITRVLPAGSPPDDAQQRLTDLLNAARAAKAARRHEDALDAFQNVLRLDPANREATEEVRSLPALISSERLTPGESPNLQTYLLYGAVSAFVVMFGVIGFVLIQNIRRERELIKQVSQMQEFVANQSSGRFPTVGNNPVIANVTGQTAGLTPEQFAALQLGGGALGAGGVMGLGNGPVAESGLGQGLGGGLGLGLSAQSSLSPALNNQGLSQTAVAGRLTASDQFPTAIVPPASPSASRGPLPDDVRLSSISGPAPLPVAVISSPVAATQPANSLPPPPEVKDAYAIPGLSPELPPLPPVSLDTTLASNASPSLTVGGSLPTAAPISGSSPALSPNDSNVGIDSRSPSESPSMPSMDSGIHDLKTVLNMPQGHAIGSAIPESSSGNLFPPVPQLPPGMPAQQSPTGYDSAIRGVTPGPPLAENQDSSSMLVTSDPGRGVIFQQNFDEEAPEEQPSAWGGEYEYATLTVDRSIAASNTGQSLKFEKRTGAGSASYVCRFPKASGQVRIEFDIRCDDKNKYLLGFYIEKDEDFKQSIHTIIHRMDSKSTPSLRVQGEPVPYEFGTWRHMTYELNLQAGMVTAYVDGEQVIKDARLPTAPSYVNTLSIRDNLATTGVLYLDNITVTRM
jgi:hypothetical protein